MRWTTCFSLLALIGFLGCEQLNFRSQTPEEDPELMEDFNTKLETKLLGEYTTIAGLNMITLEGVGLVTGLDKTGGDPPPSNYRTVMLDIMRRNGVKNPNQVLASPNTALVVVRAYLPPLIQKGEKFDIEVRVPPGSETVSLAGGYLLKTDLSEQAIVPGQGVMKGHIMAKAEGPILVSTQSGNRSELAGVLKRGRILGGGLSLKDRALSLYLRNDYRNVRQSQRVADRIGKRFFDYNRYGSREPLAEAKTDQLIELKLHPNYKENFPRYLQVIRHIAANEKTVARRVRIQRLREELLIPPTSEKAALQLEAIGQEAVGILKSGLKSPSLEVRFHSAVALTYLGDSSGLKPLADAAREEPAFRIFALAALGASEDGEANILLRDLMSGKSEETRYGAFRALTTLDKNDPFIRGEMMNEQFMFHSLEVEGPPLVHITHHRKSEVVLFGHDQEFRVPLSLRAGTKILVTAPASSNIVTVSRFELGSPDQQKIVSTRLEDVIRAVVDLGGNYPDVAQLLIQAELQNNLPGRLGIDSLPRAGRVYYRPKHEVDHEGKGSKQSRVGNPNMSPNLFDLQESKSSRSKDADEENDEDADRKPTEDDDDLDNENQSDTVEKKSKQAMLMNAPPEENSEGSAGNEKIVAKKEAMKKESTEMETEKGSKSWWQRTFGGDAKE